MSIRTNIGDILFKKPLAGFIIESAKIQIPDITENKNYDFCTLDCGDPECREWATVWILDAKGNVIGTAFHVAECEMGCNPVI